MKETQKGEQLAMMSTRRKRNGVDLLALLIDHDLGRLPRRSPMSGTIHHMSKTIQFTRPSIMVVTKNR